MAKHGVQGIVVEFVDTAQCIVVEKFEAWFPCRLYLLISLSRFRLFRCVSNQIERFKELIRVVSAMFHSSKTAQGRA